MKNSVQGIKPKKNTPATVRAPQPPAPKLAKDVSKHPVAGNREHYAVQGARDRFY